MLSASGQQAFTSGTLGNAYIWDLTTSEQIARLALKKREYIITSARFSHDDQLLATGAPAPEINGNLAGQLFMRWRLARTANLSLAKVLPDSVRSGLFDKISALRSAYQRSKTIRA